MNGEIKEKIEKLKNSPLFAMSLASKELFHSNFWAWLFERNIGYANIFFSEIHSLSEVKREEEHRDLSLHEGKKVYVIENKLKSIPSIMQLNEYKRKLGDRFAGGVFTGIETPAFYRDDEKENKSCPGWKFLPYSEISKRITETAELVESDLFEKELILQYAEMIGSISDVISHYSKKVFENRLVGWKGYDNIQEIRMGDVLKKLKADQFVKYMSRYDELAQDLPSGYKLKSSASFSNASSIVDFRYIKGQDKEEEFLIGIQIQGTQFRKCVQVNQPNKMDELFTEYKKSGWFSDPQGEKRGERSIDGRVTSMRNEYGCYGKKEGMKYSFVYQYWNLADLDDKEHSEELSFEYLAELIREEMGKAREHIKE